MNSVSYKPLPERFNKFGYTFSLLKREGDVAIFKQHKKKRIFNYEVVIIGRHNGYEINGMFFEPSEFYPSTSEWGTKGFTCTSLEAAEIRFDKLKEKIETKEKDPRVKAKSKIKK